MVSYIKHIILFFQLFGIVLSAAIIKGVVEDEQTGSPLIGASVFIDGTDLGSASDINGTYLISDIKACSTCKYTLKVLYIGYEEYSTSILIANSKEYIIDLSIIPSSLEVETTTVTAKKRRDKITDAPAAIELVSASDIKREESTNLGSYLKGLKGVDFTSSGVNNYSISVRGFNSSFTSRLLTLTDGRVANIPALRVINYSTVPQSSKDIESIEVVLGPSTALYGANAHSGVVNISSKSPSDSEGLDISISGSAADERDLYKFSSRWANKISDKLSFKLSAMYLEAYEWEYISQEEHERHLYPWVGNPSRMTDGKDNNPWGFTVHDWEISGIKQSIYHNYSTDGTYSVFLDNENDCRMGGDYECVLIEKYIGDGEANDTGDPDQDGFMGEDWFNGYDDDGDARDIDGDGYCNGQELIDGTDPNDPNDFPTTDIQDFSNWIDEDYFFADGIDNDGDCPGDTNGDGISCGPGDDNVDEQIDWTTDEWIDGVDNNGNGLVDEGDERYDEGTFFWQEDLQENDIIISNGRQYEIHEDKYDLDGDGELDKYYNIWYNGGEDTHLRGTYIFDEDNNELLFDVYVYDFGDNGIPGDYFGVGAGDLAGDGELVWDEGNNQLLFDVDNDGFLDTLMIPSESCLEPSSSPANGACGDQTDNFDLQIHDCGLDGICEQVWNQNSGQYETNPNWTGADFGEGNGVWDNFDFNGDELLTSGDAWIDSNSNNIWDPDTDFIDDNYPAADGIYNMAGVDGIIGTNDDEFILDCGQDGICYDNPNLQDFGEGDGIFSILDLDGSELDAKYDTGDNCFGCEGEPFVDYNNNGYYDCGSTLDPNNCDSYTDTDNNGEYSPGDYKPDFKTVYDINGDGFSDYPDFEVKNSKTEFRLDYDPSNDFNITFQTGYSLSKLQQVTGIGRYLADNYEYTYYQLRGRYKNWFSQLYLNQGNSGYTRGYLLGDMIKDKSKNIAFQLQHNIDFKNTSFVWGIDYFRTEANTNGSILNDGPNGYDNDGDDRYIKSDDVDSDNDSDDFSDWGIDGIGPYEITCGVDGLCPGDEGYIEQDEGEGDLVIDACLNCEEVVNCTNSNSSYNAEFDFCFIDANGDGSWDNENSFWPYYENLNWPGPDAGEGNGIPDIGEPGVGPTGQIIVDGADNDCDGCDWDLDGYPNFQEIQLNTNPYDPSSKPQIDPESYQEGYDEMIDEDWCGPMQYQPYVAITGDDSFYTEYRDGKDWKCSEGVDEPDEYKDIISNQIGFYFQTKTIPKKNKKFEIITAARFDHHDQLEEGIQFAPKFGLFYKPTNFQTFRITYGKAYNTPSALTLATDIFVRRIGFVEYYLRGNTTGTSYVRVNEQLSTSIPQIYFPSNDYNLDGIVAADEQASLYNIVNLTGGTGEASYWDGYEERVAGAPYFFGFNTPFSDSPEYMPLDTSLYTIWVPELADSGRIYTPLESLNILDVSPIKTEKIQTLEIGFKGFLSERIHATLDLYTSFYEDFFSAPTVITPLIIKRKFIGGQDVTSVGNLESGDIVGMLPSNDFGSNPPYATQWDGRDNDNDWHCRIFDDNCFLTGILDSEDDQIGYMVDINDTTPDTDIDLYDLFGWEGIEEEYEDVNENNMYDFGEIFYDCDSTGEICENTHPSVWEDSMGNGLWNCHNCSGEWGYVEYFTETVGTSVDTLGFTIHHPYDIINRDDIIDGGNVNFGAYQDIVKKWVDVGVDEYSGLNGLSEAEMITSPIIDANGNNIIAPGFAYTPFHSVLAPMNYGEVWMQGLDIGLTYLMPEYKVALDANFSFYKTTEYYNILTRKNDPINAPKFKMNASINWESPIGNIAIKYRHVDQFTWKDGIWAGTIGPYDLIDIHYNYKINKHLEFNITGLNVFDHKHKQMVGGAVMGRQIILRMSTAI